MTDPKIITTALHQAVKSTVDNLCPSVIEPQRKLMAASLTGLVAKLCQKFEKGQKEHGGFIQERNLDHEIEQEVLDFFWYTEARHWPKPHTGQFNHHQIKD